jgi:hypothetical protein
VYVSACPHIIKAQCFPVTDKKGNARELVNVLLFDDTADASLSLWGSMVASAIPWKASQTVLLLSRPGWRIDRKAWLSITSNTMIDVDPAIPDANWLRTFAQRMIRKEHVNPSFPGGREYSLPGIHSLLSNSLP